MDKKLDISGQKGGDSPNATYKPIPDADGEDIPLTRPKSLVTSKPTTPDPDGATEKMLPDEEQKVSPNSNINAGDVKFVTNEKQNGDAKIDIGEVKAAFVGMGKEELMKYANDPFWVRLRWFLFITFWLIWAAMLVGAILIIVSAPKCSPPEPRTWWEQGPLTEVQVDLSEEKLTEIKLAGIQGVIVDYDSTDAYNILKNDSDKFALFMEKANKSDINVIVSLNPVTSRYYFEDFEKKYDNVSDYYIWHTKNAKGEVPTNWRRPDNTSAWTYSDARQEYYLSLNGEPQLNYRSKDILEKSVEVLKAFLKLGVKGVQLKDASFLLIGKMIDEPLMHDVKTSMEDFNFYAHTQTKNNEDLAPLLKTWRDVVKNETKDGPFFISDEIDNLQPFVFNNSLTIDLPKHSHVFSSGKTVNASLLKHNLNSTFTTLGDNWPIWERNKNNIPIDVQDMITLLLPGTTMLPADHKVNKELLKLRKTSPSIMYGNCTTYTVANDTVFAFVRVAAGNPGYLVAVNPTNTTINVNFLEEVPLVSEEVTIQLYSSNYSEPNIEPKLKAYAQNIPISPNSGIVLTYVPKSKE